MLRSAHAVSSLSAFLIVSPLLAGSVDSVAGAERPNIVIMMADDMGFSDIGCYGGEILYVAYTAPHWPMHALPEDIERYRGRYEEGWDALRRERHARMIRMGIVNEEWRLTPRDDDAPAWEDAEDKPWFERRMEVYAAMIDRMDQGIGRIVDALRETGKLDDTLILFLADNGGCAEEYGSTGAITPPLDADIELAPMAPEEIQTRMQPRVTRDGRPVRTGRGVMPGPADTYIAYGKPWANASNTPFRLYKHWVHEGGISTPLIAHWPKVIERRGEREHQAGHLARGALASMPIDGLQVGEDRAGAVGDYTAPNALDAESIDVTIELERP